MRALLNAFWNDEKGFVVSAELVLVSTICVIALVVGLTQVSQAVNNELRDVAAAYSNVNQSYYAGDSQFTDMLDHTPGNNWSAGSSPEDGSDIGG